jgi:hypothetical protein
MPFGRFKKTRRIIIDWDVTAYNLDPLCLTGEWKHNDVNILVYAKGLSFACKKDGRNGNTEKSIYVLKFRQLPG